MNAVFLRSLQTELDAPTLAELAEFTAEVERELVRQMGSHVRLVEMIGRHTLDGGGKRLRPALVLMAARATGLPFEERRAVDLGACLEMIHMATLIHDDVIDTADTRRGRPTASAVFGNTGSILSGDVLLAKAMRLLAQDGDLRIIRAVSNSVVEMAEGEVREIETRGQFDLPEADHLQVLRMKTSAFIEVCCEVGGLLANAPDETLTALRTLGHGMGMAFQLADDVLDYRGHPASTGKARGTDYLEGCPTLPLLVLREKLNEEERRYVQAHFGASAAAEEIEMIVSWMEERGAFEHVLNLADGYADDGLRALAQLPASKYRDLLETVARYVVRRPA